MKLLTYQLIGLGLLTTLISQVSCSRKAIVVKQGRVVAFNQPIDLERTSRQWQEIKSGDTSMVDSYNETVENIIAQIAHKMTTRRPSDEITLRTSSGNLPLIIDTGGIESPHNVDRIVPIDSIRVKRGIRSNVRVDGLGAPLAVRQRWTQNDPMISVTGLWYPVTATLDLDKPHQPILRFLDPTQMANAQVSLGNSSLPLQADYTAAIARDLYDRQTQFVNLSGLIKYEKFSEYMGLFRISAFNPGKIPVVFVHGLKSTPNTWNDTLNEMMADPIIRDRYEFWTFGYPTGAPIPFISARLRSEIEEMTAYRRSRGSQSNRVTILAHSMGGLISKPLTQSSGMKLWDQVFNVPAEQVNVSSSDQKLLSDMFIFEPLPYIDRMVFMAVPHRGSPLSDQRTGAIADLIIQAPHTLVTLAKLLVSDSNHQLTPLGLRVVGRVPTSVQQLNTNSPAINLFSPLPLNDNVSYHSIIGNEKGSEKVPDIESSDGVVEYSSSSITGVKSEKVFEGKHGIHVEPKAIAEIVRILHENVGITNSEPVAPVANTAN